MARALVILKKAYLSHAHVMYAAAYSVSINIMLHGISDILFTSSWSSWQTGPYLGSYMFVQVFESRPITQIESTNELIVKFICAHLYYYAAFPGDYCLLKLIVFFFRGGPSPSDSRAIGVKMTNCRHRSSGSYLESVKRFFQHERGLKAHTRQNQRMDVAYLRYDLDGSTDTHCRDVG